MSQMDKIQIDLHREDFFFKIFEERFEKDSLKNFTTY